jgi:hypothetical protein
MAPRRNPPDRVDLAITQIRIAALMASIRALRYRASDLEVSELVTKQPSNEKAFREIERRQPLTIKVRILWRRFVRWHAHRG